jgi:poly(beta-D-mannuronate) lyase
MKNIFLLISTLFLFFSCGEKTQQNSIFVKDILELNKAIDQIAPGDEIVLANGVWKDAKIKFFGKGTKELPISLRAETAGEVFIEGLSYLHLGGEYLNISGLYFRNGYTPSTGIIRYKIGEHRDSVANNSRVTNCVIEDFTRPNRLVRDRWVELYGRHNQIDHCYISGKSNNGVTLMVYHDGNENTNNHHQIVNNYFGPRPRKGGPRAETIRIGNPQSTPGYVNVANNYFEACNGEVEIISDKADDNYYRNNIFYKCEGSLVLRHANYATVDGNIFIGGDDSDFYGGIRMGNIGHWVVNNYFYKIKGEQFRSPLAVMNGTHLPIINRYKQVRDVRVAYNTWVDCKSPLQIGVGQNIKSADVLPASEIRNMPPVRSTIANNLIFNTKADKSPLVNHSELEGILFRNNVVDNNRKEYAEFEELQSAAIEMKKINSWLYAPVGLNNKALNNPYNGYEFSEKIQKDLFGSSRTKQNSIGAINDLSMAESFTIDKKKYGPKWFSTEKIAVEAKIVTASSREGELAKRIEEATSGDVIELSDEIYQLTNSLKIDKEITIRTKDINKKSKIIFKDGNDFTLFQMNPKGVLKLENVVLKGGNSKHAFAPLKENMSSAYNLFIKNCEITDFDYVLKATKASFADSINFKKTIIKNCKNGIELAADIKGDYNAEMVTFDQCEFNNVQSNVINFFRDGYDESTIGGVLTVSNSTFTDCGKMEESEILIKTRGIINVQINENTFKNNPIVNVAVLWGEKNNHHKNNTLTNSGKIKVEEQQKLNILY